MDSYRVILFRNTIINIDLVNVFFLLHCIVVVAFAAKTGISQAGIWYFYQAPDDQMYQLEKQTLDSWFIYSTQFFLI